jgi:guanylate kinase
MATSAEVHALRTAGEIVWENQRYGAIYLVDRTELLTRLAAEVPVLHLGQVEAIDAITTATPGARWFVVYLWCPRNIAVERITARGTDDVEDRMRAWDRTAALLTRTWSSTPPRCHRVTLQP